MCKNRDYCELKKVGTKISRIVPATDGQDELKITVSLSWSSFHLVNPCKFVLTSLIK